VEALLARRLDPDLPVMRAIGVPEPPRFLLAKGRRIRHSSPASKPRGAMPSGSSPGPGTSLANGRAVRTKITLTEIA
jgi:hypothetical protein